MAGDYDRAVLRVAIATRAGHPQLLFAWLELLPPEIPSPPGHYDKQHFKGVQFSVCRLVLTLDEGLDWYDAAWAGQAHLPRSTIAIDTPPFVAEPPVKRFALHVAPPFSPTWHMTPRIHRLAPSTDLDGAVAEVAVGIASVAAFKRARLWLEGQLHFDVLAHDDWLGSVAVVAPNPLIRGVGVRITSRDSPAETVEIGGELRTGKNPTSLTVIFQERRGEAAGVHEIVPISAHGYAQARFEGQVSDLGFAIACANRGLLHEAMPSWFMRGFETYTQVLPDATPVTVPARKANRPDTIVHASAQAPRPLRAAPPITGERRVAELEGRRRRRFGELRPLAIGPEQRDTLLFKSDRGQAVEHIRRLIGRARSRVIFVDHYFGAQDLLEFATAVTQQNIAITVLAGRWTEAVKTSPVGAPHGLTGADWLEQTAAALAADPLLKPAAVELMISAGGEALHDRFLVIDDEAWHCGHSFNKVGDGEISAMTRIARPDETIALILAQAGKAESYPKWKADVLAGNPP